MTQFNGNIGIGTVSPACILHLVKNGADPTPGPTAVTSNTIRMEYIASVGSTTTAYDISVGGGEFSIGRKNNNTKQFKMHDNIAKFRGTFKNVGIGSGNINAIYCHTENNTKEFGWSNQINGGGNAELTTPLTFKYNPNGNSSDRVIMTMHPSGQIRVGDANTTYASYIDGSINFNEQMRFTVEGGIVAQHYVNTTQNWADWVFDSCTVNPTLQDEKISILKNKTLVGVPSAKDVKGGVDMANTDAILLMKIEQNYLNDITQENAIALLNEKIRLLELMNKELMKKIEEIITQ